MIVAKSVGGYGGSGRETASSFSVRVIVCLVRVLGLKSSAVTAMLATLWMAESRVVRDRRDAEARMTHFIAQGAVFFREAGATIIWLRLVLGLKAGVFAAALAVNWMTESLAFGDRWDSEARLAHFITQGAVLV